MNVTHASLDSSMPGLRYDGHGALSAGAASRLLFDYAEPTRSLLLDILFEPGFGANLQVCKVEIGGDTQSTDGTEASHMHGRDDLSCARGYEFWMMAEARRRNPEVVTVGLPWGAPGWVNNQSASGLYGADMLGYTLAWLRCARDAWGVTVDWLGMWNEKCAPAAHPPRPHRAPSLQPPCAATRTRTHVRPEARPGRRRRDRFYAHPTPPGYVKQLRATLDAHGFGSTRLMLVDGGVPGTSNPLWQAAADDAAFNASFDAVGAHYPCERVGLNSSELRGTFGKALWASEDW